MPQWKKSYKTIKGFTLLDELITTCVVLPFAVALYTGSKYGSSGFVIGFGSEVSVLVCGIFLFVVLTKYIRRDNVYHALFVLGYLVLMMIGSLFISVFITRFIIRHQQVDPPPFHQISR